MTTWRLHQPLHEGRAVLDVVDGPALLAGLAEGPGLAAHVDRYGALPHLEARDLVALTESSGTHGRGGAGFPFARKVAGVAAKRGTPVVVVNLSEGEPASHKDAALAQVAPHLILDGASVAAHAVGAREVHLVLPGENAEVGRVIRRAVAERASLTDHDAGSRGPFGRRGRHTRDRGLGWVFHDAGVSFVSGQSSAVLELLAGRPNLPVTTWQPASDSGLRGRPTLLSNAETYAHVGLLALQGLSYVHRWGRAGHHGLGQSATGEPGSTLLTLDGDRHPGDTVVPTVVEVPFGTPWSEILPDDRLAGPVLLGGYHGTWAAPGELASLSVSRAELAARGLSLGAGVVLPLDEGCPVDRTADLVAYLASQSARRCGPCFNGLPALASAVDHVRHGRATPAEVDRISALVDGRGACAHPDGTVRLVRSLLERYDREVHVHLRGGCELGAHRAGHTSTPWRPTDLEATA